MVIIAFQHADSLVKDNYYKEGKAINRDLSALEAAENLHLKAKIDIDPLVGEIILQLSGDLSKVPQQLQLDIIHPTDIQQDIALTLNNTQGWRYHGQLSTALSGRRYIQLSGTSPKPWRLKTDIVIDASTESKRFQFQLPE